MQTVLDSPVSTNQFFKPRFVGLVRQQAGDAVSDFLSLGSTGQPDFTFYREELSRMGKVYLLRFYGCADNASAFDPAMPLFQVSFFLANRHSGNIVWAFRKSAA